MAALSTDERTVLAAGAGDIKNALSVGTNSAGGYLVPPGYRDEFIVQMKNYGARAGRRHRHQHATRVSRCSGRP